MEHPGESPTPSAEELFGAMVRRTRDDRGWTQEELRKRLADRGIVLEKTAMIRLESGKRPIRFNEVVALSRILGLELTTMAFDASDHMPWSEYIEAEKRLHQLEYQAHQIEDRISHLELQRAELIGQRGALASQIDLLNHRLSLAYRFRTTASRESAEYAAADGEALDEIYEQQNGKEFMDRVRRTREEQRAQIERERANGER